MAEFVDVSDMTDSQVKALGQADEPDMPTRQYRGRYVRPQPVAYDTVIMFAAAAASYRIVGNQYIKPGTSYTDASGSWALVKCNRDVMVEVLSDQSQITADDQQLGEKTRAYYNGLMFKVLSGKVLTEFESKSLSLANGPTISQRDIGIVAYYPIGYINAQKRSSVDERIRDCSGGHIGRIGDKVSFRGEVVRSVFSQQWGCYFVTVITDTDQVVFFSNKNTFEAGSTIAGKGTVKNHHGDGKTQFNRVNVF